MSKFKFQPDKKDGDFTNAQRAVRVQEIVSLFSRNGFDIQDIISDLGHYCDREGIDFKDVIRVGINNWKAER